jgi:hypothetical protein
VHGATISDAQEQRAARDNAAKTTKTRGCRKTNRAPEIESDLHARESKRRIAEHGHNALGWRGELRGDRVADACVEQSERTAD